MPDSQGIVAGYIDILEDLLLAYRLNVFARRAKRKTASHPKFYFFDNGLYRRLRQRGPLDPLFSSITGVRWRAMKWISCCMAEKRDT